MWDAVLWLYLINGVLLINHEIDSAYWKEWELFRLPGGHAGFLILHFPLLFLILYGLLLVFQHSFAGLVFSLIVSFGGIFAFSIHMFFIKRGRNEFKTPVSLFILASTFIVSIIQMAVTLYFLNKGETI